MKIRPLGAEFHADGQADMTNLTVVFAVFANSPKKKSVSSCREGYLVWKLCIRIAKD